MPVFIAHHRLQPLIGPQMAVEGKEMFKFSLNSLGNQFPSALPQKLSQWIVWGLRR